MKLTSSSTARRSTAKAPLRSLGGPQIPSPVRRMAPKPRRWTKISPPSETVPATLAEFSFLFTFLFIINHLSRYCPKSVMCLAEPLRVGIGAIELVAGFIKLELADFCGFRSFCQKRCEFGRIKRLKTAGSLERLLKNRKRIAAGNDDASGKVHRIVKAFHGRGCVALENKVVTHRLHTEHADAVLQ